MERRTLDVVVVGLPHHVNYFSAHRPFWLHQAAFALFQDGRSLLIAANGRPPVTAADEVTPYDATWNGTQRQEQPALVADAIASRLTSDTLAGRLPQGAKIGVDASAVTAHLLTRLHTAETTFVDPDLWQLRRQKGPDELALMKVAIDCTRAMYERAREVIEPGVSEIRVFNELHAAATHVAGEPLSDLLGNDYASGVPGGPPKQAPAEAGELYILDLGPCYRGYFADNCRAISVDRRPTDAQMKTWDVVTGVFPLIDRLVRPGVRCRDVFDAVDAYFRERTGDGLTHHLGHGVGLEPHEYPHLNPKWDDTFVEGEVFTVEPGIYGESLGGGMRLENQYLVTATGVENLTPFPLELA